MIGENGFHVKETNGICLHPTHRVSNICVSLNDHDWILLSSNKMISMVKSWSKVSHVMTMMIFLRFVYTLVTILQ
jgi:hypothetical protein